MAVWSTVDVAAGEAFGYWADVICDAFVRVAARPVSDGAFHGRISYTEVGDVGVSRVSAGGQEVRRTGRQIARDTVDSVLVNIQLSGNGRLSQNNRVAMLTPGTLTFVDSTRPYSLDFAGTFSQLVVRVPRTLLARREMSRATAVALPSSGPAGLVTDFFTRLARLDPGTASHVLPHGLGLLECAAGWASGEAPTNTALTRARVDEFVRNHACEPGLDADAVAAGCGVSRRTLFRAMAGDSLADLIRDHRVTTAQRLLRTMPALTLAAVARDCGFAGTAQLHRAFRLAAGTTPGLYRRGTDRH